METIIAIVTTAGVTGAIKKLLGEEGHRLRQQVQKLPGPVKLLSAFGAVGVRAVHRAGVQPRPDSRSVTADSGRSPAFSTTASSSRCGRSWSARLRRRDGVSPLRLADRVVGILSDLIPDVNEKRELLARVRLAVAAVNSGRDTSVGRSAPLRFYRLQDTLPKRSARDLHGR